MKSYSEFFPCLTVTLSLDRKLKKLVRAMKDKGTAQKQREEESPPQQWNLDYNLAPFEGLTPEYMEMSESARTHTHAHRIIASGTKSRHVGTKISLK